MSYSLQEAKPMLTADELHLFEQSMPGAIDKLDPKALSSSIKRARELRSKYRDLYQRQTVQAKARGSADDANHRTRDKAQIMAELVQRFEEHQNQRA